MIKISNARENLMGNAAPRFRQIASLRHLPKPNDLYEITDTFNVVGKPVLSMRENSLL